MSAIKTLPVASDKSKDAGVMTEADKGNEGDEDDHEDEDMDEVSKIDRAIADAQTLFNLRGACLITLVLLSACAFYITGRRYSTIAQLDSYFNEMMIAIGALSVPLLVSFHWKVVGAFSTLLFTVLSMITIVLRRQMWAMYTTSNSTNGKFFCVALVMMVIVLLHVWTDPKNVAKAVKKVSFDACSSSFRHSCICCTPILIANEQTVITWPASRLVVCAFWQRFSAIM
jgi:hypothetical protein